MLETANVDPLLQRSICDVKEWDGVFSAKVKLTAQDDGIDRQSECWKGRIFDTEAFNRRKAHHVKQKDKAWKYAFNGIISNEVCFMEFFERDIYTGGSVRAFFCQVPMILERYGVIYSGRATGKTWTIKGNTLHRAVNFSGSSMFMWSHDDAHVEPRASEVFKMIDNHPFFNRLVPKALTGGRSRKPPYRQDFLNRFVCHWVYPGNEGKQLEKFHVDGVLTDESQELTDVHMEKFQPTQNDFKPVRGSICKFFGVNTQGSTDTPFYRMTFKESSFQGHVYVIPSWNNPREYSLKNHDLYLTRYGGNVEAPKFKQMIRGLLGEKAEGVFSQRHYDNCCDLRYKLSREMGLDQPLPFRRTRYDAAYLEQKKHQYHLLFPKRLEIPEITEIRAGMDFGFGGGATMIEFWFLIRGVWHLGESIELNKVMENRQAEFIHYLIGREGGSVYPDCRYMGIDITGNRNVYAFLTDVNDIRFNNPGNDYMERLVPVSFEKTVVADKVLEEPPATVRSKKTKLADRTVAWDILDDCVPFSTTLIIKRMADMGYSLPDENDIRRSEFMGMIQEGRKYIGYRGLDHTIASNRCFEMTIHEKNTVSTLESQLLNSLYNEEFTGGMGTSIDWPY